MANEGGEWIMKGLDWDNPFRIRSWRELVNWINEVGFLPLFANEATGFSAEEHVSPLYWWTGEDLGADSLDVLQMLMTIEEEHGITIPDEELATFETVGDILAFLEKNQK